MISREGRSARKSTNLASGMSYAEILDEYPELHEEDILAALSFAADKERRISQIAV
jgi:uncharacterized protein (DUF433 family)